MKHWGNDTDREKPKYTEKHLSQCHLIHHKFRMDWLGVLLSLKVIFGYLIFFVLQ
jgi:hypothetical protein